MTLETQTILMRRSLMLTAGMGLLGCTINADYNHEASNAPRQLFSPRPASAEQIRHIWVLSSGGPRGFVHIGILKALQELGHKPDMVVGGSVGSLVGALFAGGVSALELQHMSLELGLTDMGRLALKGDGKLAGTPLASIVNRELLQRCGTCEMEKLPIPFAAVAVERTTRQALLLNHGDAGVAVQASCAIEGLFTPVRIRGLQYVDADQVMPLPVRLARDWITRVQTTPASSLRLLAMDASARPEAAPPSAERYKEGDLHKRALIAQDAASANLTLHPDMSYYVNVSQEFRLRTIEQGYRQTLDRSAQIKAALS